MAATVRSWRKVLAALATMVWVLVSSAGTAWAHAELQGTEPAAGQVLDASPAQIVLRFDDRIDPIPGGMRLVRSDGSAVDLDSVGRLEGDERTVRLVPERALGPDSYVVAWRVTSADSHPVRGAFTFRVGSSSGSTDIGPLVSRLLADERSSPAAGLLLAVGRWASFAGVVLAAGWLCFGALGLHGPHGLDGSSAPQGPAWPPVGWVRRAALVGIVGTVVMVAGQAVNLRAGWSASVDPAAYRDALSTVSGRWWAVRLLALVVVGVAVGFVGRAAGRRGSGGVAGVLSGAAAIGLVVVTALGGHAATGRWPALGLVATAAHLLALGVWAAALLTMLLLTRRGGGAVEFGRRFSFWALLSVAVLVASGVLNSVRQVGETALLTSTDYGRLLLVKLAAVVVLLGVASRSRRLVRAAPADTVSLDTGAATGARAGVFGRLVGVEVALVAVALAVTTALVNVRPAIAERATIATGVAVVGQRTAQVVLDPARTGGTALHVYLSSPRGTLDRASEISVTATLADRDIGPLTLETFDAGPNHVTNPDAVLPLPGAWTIDVTARYGEFEQIQFETTLRVRS